MRLRQLMADADAAAADCLLCHTTDAIIYVSIFSLMIAPRQILRRHYIAIDYGQRGQLYQLSPADAASAIFDTPPAQLLSMPCRCRQRWLILPNYASMPAAIIAPQLSRR
jgi:hypothetical protein